MPHPFLFRLASAWRCLMRTPLGAALFFCSFFRCALSRIGAAVVVYPTTGDRQQ